MKTVCGTLAAIIASGLLSGWGKAEAFEIISFDGTFTRWKDTNVRYSVDPRGSRDFPDGCDFDGPCASVEEVIARAFASWENVGGVNLRFIDENGTDAGSGGYDKTNSILFVEKNWMGLPFSPPPNALAVTVTTYRVSDGEILDADIVFNGENFRWADINSKEEEHSGAVDLQNVATHEIGHVLGLGHSSENYLEPEPKLYLATMFFASGPGEIFRRDLGDDDKDAVRNLYAADHGTSPAVDAVDPAEVDVSLSGWALVRIVGAGFSPNATVLIAVPGDRGDIPARVYSVADDEITATFDLSGIPSGTYDIIVANTYDRRVRAEKALTLINGSAGWNKDGEESSYSMSGGGCSAGPGGSPVLLLLCVPLLLILTARRQFTRVRRKQFPSH